MADYTFTEFPIDADEIDIDQLQQDVQNVTDDILNINQAIESINQRLTALTGRTINGKPLSSDIVLTPDDIDAVPETREINGYDLSEDRTLFVQDIPSKNLLPNTATTQTVNGVTFTVNGDGSVSTSGTATANVTFNIGIFTEEIASQFSGCVLTGCPSGGGVSSYHLETQRNGSPWTTYGADYGEGVTLGVIDASAFVFIAVTSGTNMNGKTFYPMIRPAGADDTYVPYAITNVELSKLPITKLGSDTYLDASGVAVNNSGRTLANALNTHLLGQTTINNLASQSTGSINLSGVDTYSYIMVVCSVESRRIGSVILPTALANVSHFHVTVMYNQSIGLWSDCFMNAAKTNISITVRGVTNPFVDNSATYYVYGIL